MTTMSLAPDKRESPVFLAEVPRVHRRVELLLSACLLGVALVVLSSYALVAAVHWNDRFQVNFISGIYTTLAARLNEGTFYPPLHDGEHYAGTRYMPLPFALQAGLERFTDDYLAAGKLLAYTLTAVLGLELFLILRRIGCDRCASLALISLALTSAAVFLAATTIRGDLLPVVLQLAAVLVGTKALTDLRATLAGVLCTMAVLAKITAGWAPLALACYYFHRQKRCCAFFLAAWLGSLLAALGFLHLASGGRMLANFTALSAAGVQGPGAFLKAPLCLFLQASQDGALQGFLIPVALIGCLSAVRVRQFTVDHGCFLFCLPILLVIYADKGTDYNHLLDLVVLAVPLAGHLWVNLCFAERRLPGLGATVVCALVWVSASSWANTMAAPVRQAVDSLRNEQPEAQRPGKPLARLIDDDEAILSEDPWVAVARGQVPCILDPYAFARLAECRPGLANGLLDRVRSEEFDKVVLLRDAETGRTNGGEDWYQRHLGPELIGSIRAHYRLAARAEGYFVYVPKRHPGQGTSERASR
jgi:hypothetical protein